jgi:hypothetical protein
VIRLSWVLAFVLLSAGFYATPAPLQISTAEGCRGPVTLRQVREMRRTGTFGWTARDERVAARREARRGCCGHATSPMPPSVWPLPVMPPPLPPPLPVDVHDPTSPIVEVPVIPRPYDPHGIYTIGLGVPWSQLEPDDYLYNFDSFDRFMLELRHYTDRWRRTGVYENRYHGKPLQLTVMAGQACPTWLVEQVEQSFPVQDSRTGKEIGRYPDASDKHYQHARKRLEKALQKRYGDWCHIEFEFCVNDRGKHH